MLIMLILSNNDCRVLEDNLKVHRTFFKLQFNYFAYHTRQSIMATVRRNARLPPEVNRVLFVKNLPFKITAEEMYDIFGKYGAIRQMRVGNSSETKGTAFVIYE